MYQTILHATDLNSDHFSFCQKAHELAQHFNAKLFFLHVIEPPASLQLAQGLGFAEFDAPQKTDAETVMKSLTEAFNLPKSHGVIEIGSIKQHIVEKIQQLNCDLLIIGNHDTKGLEGFLTDHKIKNLLDTASCDVMTFVNVKKT